MQVVATGRLFRAGVLVKSGDALERLAEADTIVFDKTGTLTFGKPRIANRPDIPDDVFAAAAALARISRHPLSRAIVAEAGPGKAAPDAVEFPGEGIEGIVGGVRVRLGRAAWTGAPETEDAAQETWVRIGDAAPVRFRFEDCQRADAADAIRRLEQLGLRVEMLSGDRESAAAKVAEDLGLEYWRAQMTPREKIDHLESLRAEGRKIAMVGDGLNDAPSLAAAHASLSPGTAADATQAAADFVYQGDGVSPIVDAVLVSRASRRRVIENFIFAAAYNALAMPLAAMGLVTPLIAAIAMSGSSMIVTLNALRLAGGRRI